MTKRNIMLGGAVGLLSLGAVASASALGNSAQREAVKEALQNRDYAAFVEATKDGKRAEVINSEAQFNKLIEMHELREAGDKEGAHAIREELGLKMHGKGGHRNPAVKAALEANDWSAFQAATKDGKLGEIIDTEAEFNKLVEAVSLHKAGDHNGAKEIKEELGLKGPGHGKGERGERGEHHRGDINQDN